jgi:hypothetical protein
VLDENNRKRYHLVRKKVLFLFLLVLPFLDKYLRLEDLSSHYTLNELNRVPDKIRNQVTVLFTLNSKKFRHYMSTIF